jgi:hypothetical protein
MRPSSPRYRTALNQPLHYKPHVEFGKKIPARPLTAQRQGADDPPPSPRAKTQTVWWPVWMGGRFSPGFMEVSRRILAILLLTNSTLRT